MTDDEELDLYWGAVAQTEQNYVAVSRKQVKRLLAQRDALRKELAELRGEDKQRQMNDQLREMAERYNQQDEPPPF